MRWKTRHKSTASYLTGLAFAAIAAMLMVWTQIVRDDGEASGYFMIIFAIGVGMAGAGMKSAGIVRAMIAVAAMQVSFGILLATATSAIAIDGEPFRVLLYNGFFAALWLLSAQSFRVAARDLRESEGTTAPIG